MSLDDLVEQAAVALVVQPDVVLALLQEFRTRLIADVVTGKLDARAAVAGLPEIIEPEPFEEHPEDENLDEGIDEPAAEEEAA